MEHKQNPTALQKKLIYQAPAFSRLYNGVISCAEEYYTVIPVNYMDIGSFPIPIKMQFTGLMTFLICHQM